ncbi:hypothetical protein GXN76_04450 [Kroppenstedtia pulmonis]|uniref:Uncharacterized protein n=1 Tax=Kroppenstedtia pulmonis TaxID=1380685 RepID=A0A7D3XI70_9BACL|nr:hypothetical protein [Kroppenstedtia pulmonis]QKG83799.1 hypothetical protein GXN76_04450 [Kroppenstedtia pulmonis]
MLLLSFLLALLFITLTPSTWKHRWRDRSFITWQVLRYLAGVAYGGFTWYVAVIDQSVSAYVAYYGWVVAGGLILDAVLYSEHDRRTPNRSASIGGVVGILLVLGLLYSWLIYPITITKDQYEIVNGKVSEKDLEPMNEQNIPVVPREYAVYKTEKVLGKVKNYFYYDVGEPAIQKISGKLYWVTPLEYKGFFKWWRAGETPGYITMSAEDPRSDARFVEAKMKYTPSAYLGDNLLRHIRKQYPDIVIMGTSFEPDEKGKPYYAVSYGYYHNYRDTRDVNGVILVEPQSGKMKQYPLKQVPDFVDQVIPYEVAQERNEWFGLYKHGWFNSWMGKRDVSRPTDWDGINELVAVFDRRGDMHWVTDHTRDEAKSGSMVGYTMLNSRTGELTFYHGANGMLNGKSAIHVVEKTFREKRWQGTTPSLYNIYGEFTWVVPTVDSNGVLRQFVLVDAQDEKVLGSGDSKSEAFNNYQYAISTYLDGDDATPTTAAKITKVKGKVAAVHKTVKQDDTLVQFLLEGEDTIFTIYTSKSPYALFLEKGHKVEVEYIDTEELHVAVKTMKNVTLDK